jgi:hypothetical protein
LNKINNTINLLEKIHIDRDISDSCETILSFSSKNLSVLRAACIETCREIDDWEFQTRTGVEKEEFSAVILQLEQFIEQLSNNG